MSPILIAVDGNYCSGKSLLIKILKNTFENEIVFLEDTDYINDDDDIYDSIENTLKKYYENPKKYAFSYLMLCLINKINRLNKILKFNSNSFIIFEKSILADKMVCGKLMYDTNLIDEIDYKIYLKYYNEFINSIKISGIIYLDSIPSVCFDRLDSKYDIKELNITYLRKYSKYYEEWLKTTPYIFLKLDSNINIRYKKYVIRSWMRDIFNFLSIFSRNNHEKKMFKYSENYPYEIALEL